MSSITKIKSKAALRKILQQIQKKGGRVVFTNGCFDILHHGHVAYLEQAKKLGTHLLVAVNSDASVRKLKGKGRPINRLRARLTVLAALEAVDFVTWFGEDTPLGIIRTLKPNVLVKGGDYNASTIVGAKDVKKTGGRVAILPFVDGFSTTSILRRLKTDR